MHRGRIRGTRRDLFSQSITRARRHAREQATCRCSPRPLRFRLRSRHIRSEQVTRAKALFAVIFATSCGGGFAPPLYPWLIRPFSEDDVDVHPWMENNLDFSFELSSFNTAPGARPFVFRATRRATRRRPFSSRTLHGLQANQHDDQGKVCPSRHGPRSLQHRVTIRGEFGATDVERLGRQPAGGIEQATTTALDYARFFAMLAPMSHRERTRDARQYSGVQCTCEPMRSGRTVPMGEPE